MTIIAMDDLEHPCWECNGRGKIEATNTGDPEAQNLSEEVPCPALGQTLLDFVKRNL